MADEEKPLDAGFLYSPMFWRGDKQWKPKPGQCRASVRGSTYMSHQCDRKAKVTREVLRHGKLAQVEYCGQHDPVKVKAAHDKRQAKWKANWNAKQAKSAEDARLNRLGNAARKALKQIAAGHNDPRTLALEVLAKHGESL